MARGKLDGTGSIHYARVTNPLAADASSVVQRGIKINYFAEFYLFILTKVFFMWYDTFLGSGRDTFFSFCNNTLQKLKKSIQRGIISKRHFQIHTEWKTTMEPLRKGFFIIFATIKISKLKWPSDLLKCN